MLKLVTDTDTELKMSEQLTFSTQVDEVASTVTLSVAGECDIYSSPQLAATLMPVMNDHQRIVVDLSQVTFIDASGLGVLIAAQKAAVKAGKQLVLIVDPKGKIRFSFEITSLVRYFTICDTLSEAF